jgi:hypothetical protein
VETLPGRNRSRSDFDFDAALLIRTSSNCVAIDGRSFTARDLPDTLYRAVWLGCIFGFSRSARLVAARLAPSLCSRYGELEDDFRELFYRMFGVGFTEASAFYGRQMM